MLYKLFEWCECIELCDLCYDLKRVLVGIYCIDDSDECCVECCIVFFYGFIYFFIGFCFLKLFYFFFDIVEMLVIW